MVEIVELILEFNELDQEGSALKILAPNQMLSRLPIFLTHLKVGNNSEKLKKEIKKIFYSLYRSKKLKRMFMKGWLTLFKHENNLYEH